MKVFIWLSCFFVFAAIQTLAKNAGILLGGIPTALLCGLTYWCANKLCKVWETHKEKKDAAKDPTDAALADFLADTAAQHAEFIKANKDAQSLNLDDPEYGLVPEKPVYCCYVDGSKDYLSNLRTVSGEKLEWNRRGSVNVEGIHGMVDIYDSTLPSGQPYKTIYINMYADSNQLAVPSGFTLHFSSKKKASAPASGAKRRFPVLTVLLCLAVIALAVLLAVQRGQYEAQISELRNHYELQISELEGAHESCADTIFDLQRELLGRDNSIEFLNERIDIMNDKTSFFDDHAVIVLNDGSGKYHKYDCLHRVISDSRFWIYNIEAAIDRGYEACSLCCD